MTNEIIDEKYLPGGYKVQLLYCWLNGHVYEVRLVHGEKVIDRVERVFAFELDDVVSALEEKAGLLRSF